MKSGRHFNASESLDNLPLTHPEHFGTPVGSRRRGRIEEEEEESSSDEDEESNQPYAGFYFTGLYTLAINLDFTGLYTLGNNLDFTGFYSKGNNL